MYDQFRLQNLRALGSSRSNCSISNCIQSSDTCKKTITIVYCFLGYQWVFKTNKVVLLMDSENIILEFLKEYYRIASSMIAHNNGVWDKTIGDGHHVML